MPTPSPLPAVCVEDYAGQAERSCYAFMYFWFLVLVFGATSDCISYIDGNYGGCRIRKDLAAGCLLDKHAQELKFYWIVCFVALFCLLFFKYLLMLVLLLLLRNRKASSSRQSRVQWQLSSLPTVRDVTMTAAAKCCAVNGVVQGRAFLAGCLWHLKVIVSQATHYVRETYITLNSSSSTAGCNCGPTWNSVFCQFLK